MAGANSAEEISGLRKSLEQEDRVNQEEIKNLKSQLESMTFEMKETERTLKQ